MHISRLIRTLPLALVGGSLPLLLTLSLHGQPVPPSPRSVETPQQVADTLDSIVQPRFQQNAGRFGVDRVLLEGHDNAYGLAAENTVERRKFRQVNGSHRPYVVAFLHCAHKPGQYLHSKERGDAGTNPYVQVLATATATQDGSGRLWDWGDTHLSGVARPALTELRQGNEVDKDLGNWCVVMRPVRAWQNSCLGCHAGAKRGDTLGVMIYAVDKAIIHAPIRSFDEGDH